MTTPISWLFDGPNALLDTSNGLRLYSLGSSSAGRAVLHRMGTIPCQGDAATATSVMTDLYLKMKDQPFAPDLDTLWLDLGIQINFGIVSFDDTARLAAVRRAITHMPADHATL